jgi:hypothetical protein
MNENNEYKIWKSDYYLDKLIVKKIEELRVRPFIVTTDHGLKDLINSVNYNVKFKVPTFL